MNGETWMELNNAWIVHSPSSTLCAPSSALHPAMINLFFCSFRQLGRPHFDVSESTAEKVARAIGGVVLHIFELPFLPGLEINTLDTSAFLLSSSANPGHTRFFLGIDRARDEQATSLLANTNTTVSYDAETLRISIQNGMMKMWMSVVASFYTLILTADLQEILVISSKLPRNLATIEEESTTK
ncbi:hypothetical protein Hypma_008252 [Hypsizygus marmoreus]|uniref:Uncharacterized protein n=1 Tax=Hypsizygus marmoreus TaxID=39966 RepID=A0A369JYS3_HYPMA|nr:hypothetical protein Hypma_008252 [Hypsizygus marmoreus]